MSSQNERLSIVQLRQEHDFISVARMRVLIIGCGYAGIPLGKELIRLGHSVVGLRRSPDAEPALRAIGIEPFVGDITRPDTLTLLPRDFDWVVNLVSSSGGGVDDYRSIYLDGSSKLIEHFQGAPVKKFVYTSSTSVYGQTDGSAVKETSATDPASETSKVLVEAENVLLAAARNNKFPAIILRVAGIYGAGRGHLLRQYLANEAKIYGKGDRVINMIHRDDLIGAIVAALQNGRAGEIYNVVDDEPVAQIHFFRWLAESLGKWMPPTVPEGENPNRKRGLTNKKVQNRKIKMELGHQLKFPTFRQGYTAEIQELEKAGKLNIELEPR